MVVKRLRFALLNPLIRLQRDNPDTFTTAFLAQAGDGRKGKIRSMAWSNVPSVATGSAG
jgi:hypothetical protein